MLLKVEKQTEQLIDIDSIVSDGAGIDSAKSCGPSYIPSEQSSSAQQITTNRVQDCRQDQLETDQYCYDSNMQSPVTLHNNTGLQVEKKSQPQFRPERLNICLSAR